LTCTVQFITEKGEGRHDQAVGLNEMGAPPFHSPTCSGKCLGTTLEEQNMHVNKQTQRLLIICLIPLCLSGCTPLVLIPISIATLLLIGIVVALAMFITSIAGALANHFPREYLVLMVTLATQVTIFAMWRLLRVAWQTGRPSGVRILLLTPMFILAYELYVLFAMIIETTK
jgi:hypothetical protein